MASKERRGAGFTLVEMLVSTCVLALLLLLLFTMLNAGTTLWTRGSAKIQAFQEARAAYEAMTRKVSQSTLNIYWDYETNATGDPTKYKRQSELQFVSGPAADLLSAPAARTHSIFFQAPLGYTRDTNSTRLRSLLNASGFFLEYGSDNDTNRPAFLSGKVPERSRFRLKELWQPTEEFSVYSNSIFPASWPAGGASYDWFRNSVQSASEVATLAENIIALVVLPKLPEREDPSGTGLVGSAYLYNSQDSTKPNTHNQLPPTVQIVMVAIDEKSAARFAGSGTPDYGITNWDQLFQDPSKLAGDLQTLESGLARNGITYQVFNSVIPIEGAKWSR